MMIGKPAPCVSAFVEAVDDAIREHHPSHAMSATQRAWLAFGVTAVLVTNALCWARFERASLSSDSLAALSWMFRHRKIPGDTLLVARVRVIVRHHDITSGPLVIDETANPRSTSATALAPLYKRREKERGGSLFSAACKSSRPSAAIRTFGLGSANNTSPTLVPPIRGHPSASASGVVKRWWRLSAVRGCPSAPTTTKRLIVALRDNDEERYRDLIASDLRGRPLDMVQGQTRRGLVEVFMQDWKSSEGGSPLTKQPGEEGARPSVILSLLVDHRLFVHPNQQAQRKNHLPADTVGSLRTNMHVECLVKGSDALISSDNPQEKLKHFPQALHEVFAFGPSKTHMIQRLWGRLEPTPFLKYRADEVMRNMPVLAT